MSNQPTITTRDRGLSISIFEREKDGQKTYGACLQRSWKDKNTDEWKREQINLFPDELLKIANTFSDKYYVYLKDGNPLFEYKVYKNNNVHIKLNKEFAKAMNVEVSRLLGWIRCKEDIAKEFPEELSNGAEKYFKTNNFIPLAANDLKLLGTTAA